MHLYRFDGQPIITLHAPNNSPLTCQRIFEIEDFGETLPVRKISPE